MTKISSQEAKARSGLSRGIIEKFIRNNRHLCEKRQEGRHWVWYVDSRAIDKLAELYAVPDGFIDTKEAAATANVKESTINQWCMNGYVEARKLPSRLWLVDLKSLNAFLEIRANAQKSAQSWATAGGNLGLHMKEPTPQAVIPPAIKDSNEKAPEAWRTNYRRGKRSGVYCARIEGERVGNATAVNDFERVHG